MKRNASSAFFMGILQETLFLFQTYIMQIILDYFPDLTHAQISQLEALEELYKEWNTKINVISRKDIENLYERHVFHSLTIAKILPFEPGAKILDLGTGGGFPGIPLAILFPETQFKLIDGTRKKITVVQEVINAIGLNNAVGLHIRAEELKEKFDFVVCRAVAPLEKLVLWSQRLIRQKQMHFMPNGLLTLKGGNLKEEIKALPKGEYVELFPLYEIFEEPYFEEKYLVYVQGG